MSSVEGSCQVLPGPHRSRISRPEEIRGIGAERRTRCVECVGRGPRGRAGAVDHPRSGTAEEAAQDTFVKAWRYAASYDPRRGPAAAWLLTIARNAALDQARGRGRR